MTDQQSTHAAELLAAALRYVGKGWPVFPCKADKTPLVAKGFKTASRDPEQVKAWWRQWPLAMIGLPTGKISGVVVIDVDVKRGINGFETLERLARNGLQIPRTVAVRTPSGGAHIYFRAPADTVRNSAGKLGPGLDIRGDGGYVILPPSCPDITGNAYGWDDADRAVH